MAAFSQEWRGHRIELSKEASVARRSSSYNGGIVYSSEPIDVNEVFQIRVDAMEMGWAGSLVGEKSFFSCRGWLYAHTSFSYSILLVQHT